MTTYLFFEFSDYNVRNLGACKIQLERYFLGNCHENTFPTVYYMPKRFFKLGLQNENKKYVII
jgi:hypothetical protein